MTDEGESRGFPALRYNPNPNIPTSPITHIVQSLTLSPQTFFVIDSLIMNSGNFLSSIMPTEAIMIMAFNRCRSLLQPPDLSSLFSATGEDEARYHRRSLP